MNSTIIVILVLTLCLRRCSGTCSTEYGAKPCSYVPSLPGNSPECAKPGITYCEYPTHYPGKIIQHLVDKWNYDHHTLLIDESRNELDNFYYMGKVHPHEYGLPHPTPQGGGGGNNGFHGYMVQQPQNGPSDGQQQLPHPREGFKPVYGPPPLEQGLPKPQVFSGDQYIPPPPQQIQPPNGTVSPTFQGYPDRRPPVPSFDIPPVNQLVSYKYTNKIPYAHSRYLQPPEFGNANQYKTLESPRINTYGRSEWLKRLNQNDKYFFNRRRRRSADMMYKLKRLATLDDYVEEHNETVSTGRHRRQAAGGTAGDGNAGRTQNLCMSRSQYIMPRAALNNRGNWMYVVNMPEVDNRLTQLVKSETCISQQCSGICSLPNGYTSRCEQKYVQKRLVALESEGNQLYTDVFWFPSCCICTITNN